MGKELSEMTLEELWQLFPIFLTEHCDEWNEWYNTEELYLRTILPNDDIISVDHIGSTAINDIWAKPIIDILVQINPQSDMGRISRILCENGYTCMSEDEKRISLNKGYTKNGFAQKVFHLHLRYKDDDNEIYFRDYMNRNPHLAKRYEKLKLSLWKKYEHNRDKYTESKTEFIMECTEKARNHSNITV